MHALLAVLKFLGILIVAGAAFYALAWFAKWRMGYWFWKNGPDAPKPK